MKENNVIIFENPDFGKVRTVCIDGEPWFVGKDVALALGYSNTRDALRKHVDGEDKGVAKCDSLGGTQEYSVINESGLYSLILSSKIPEAKAFKRWITHEVIPSIRKHGAYMTDSVLAQIAADPTLIFKLAESLLRERERADLLHEELRFAKPKADYYDAFVDPGDCTNIRNTAKELGIPQCVFTTWLVGKKILFRDLRDNLLPYSPYMKNGMFIARDFVRNGHKGVQALFTPFGKDEVRKMLAKSGLYAAAN